MSIIYNQVKKKLFVENKIIGKHSMSDMRMKLESGQDLASEDLMFLVDEISRIAENDISHLKACLMELELKRKKLP